jgi:hypothetical protein
MADSTGSANKGDNQGPQASTDHVVSNISTTRTRQPTFLGQTKASWYIYWICAVASIANIFQGFDSGIYSISFLTQGSLTTSTSVGPDLVSLLAWVSILL